MIFRLSAKRIGLPLSALAVATLSASVHADYEWRHDEAERNKMVNDWKSMREQMVRASDIMGEEVTNGLNPMGDVRDLILSPDSQSVEYVLYETNFSLGVYGNQDGFVRFDNASFQDRGYGDLELRIDDDQDAMGKDKLRLTRGEADHRLVSKMIGSSIVFGDDSAREVEDLLINRKNGKVTHFVFDMDDDAIFNEDLRTLSVNRVDIDEKGGLTTRMDLAEVDKSQEFDSDLLD